MAKLMFSGLDEIAAELSRMGEGADKVTDKMLRAGAEEVAKGWRKAIDEVGLVETGTMKNSVAPAKGTKSDGGTKFIEIYPQGTDKSGHHKGKGVRNAAKAFYNHYGTSRISATYFVDKAEKHNEKTVVPVMQAIWDKEK